MTPTAYPLAVFVLHGLLDTTTTIAVFARVETTGIETNPVGAVMLQDALMRAAVAGEPLSIVHFLPIIGVKLVTAGFVALVLWFFRPGGRFELPYWRLSAAFFVGIGLLVVVNNARFLL